MSAGHRRSRIIAGVAALIVLVFVFRAWTRTRRGKYQWDKLKLRIPIAGKIILKATLARFARSFSLALQSGVPVVQPRHGSFPELIEATGGGLLTALSVPLIAQFGPLPFLAAMTVLLVAALALGLGYFGRQEPVEATPTDAR